MILSARYVRKVRNLRTCEICSKGIGGDAITMYGMPDPGDKPYRIWVHVTCCHDTHPKVQAALDSRFDRSNTSAQTAGKE